MHFKFFWVFIVPLTYRFKAWITLVHFSQAYLYNMAFLGYCCASWVLAFYVFGLYSTSSSAINFVLYCWRITNLHLILCTPSAFCNIGLASMSPVLLSYTYAPYPIRHMLVISLSWRTTRWWSWRWRWSWSWSITWSFSWRWSWSCWRSLWVAGDLPELKDGMIPSI